MNPQVDQYLIDGCGRCKLYATPECKVHKWSRQLLELRRIVLESGLEEELKWSMPCYTYKGKNVLILAAFKDFCSLNFFKGSLIDDRYGLLEKAGENSNVARLLKFTELEDILAREDAIKWYLAEAIEIERLNKKVPASDIKHPEVPAELTAFFEQDPILKQAFYALTPGRQRGYLLHFTQAKKSETVIARIEKNIAKIMEGKGMME